MRPPSAARYPPLVFSQAGAAGTARVGEESGAPPRAPWNRTEVSALGGRDAGPTAAGRISPSRGEGRGPGNWPLEAPVARPAPRTRPSVTDAVARAPQGASIADYPPRFRGALAPRIRGGTGMSTARPQRGAGTRRRGLNSAGVVSITPRHCLLAASLPSRERRQGWASPTAQRRAPLARVLDDRSLGSAKLGCQGGMAKSATARADARPIASRQPAKEPHPSSRKPSAARLSGTHDHHR
jgi:hypothetical protein